VRAIIAREAGCGPIRQITGLLGYPETIVSWRNIAVTLKIPSKRVIA